MKKKTHEQFVKEIIELNGEDFYTFNSEYNGKENPIIVTHNICGYTWITRPCILLQKRNVCPNCSGLKRKTTKEFKQEVFNLVGNEYEVLGKYINKYTKIKMKHNSNECNNFEWNIRPDNFIYNNRRCPVCNGGIKITHEQFINIVHDKLNEYDILSEYINSETYVKVRHKKCGYEYKVLPSNFKKCGCPFCAESKGEQKIRHLLESNEVNFETQYIFNNLLSDLGNPLRFDFAIFNDRQRKQLKCLLEFDGEQHYQLIKGWQDEKSFGKLKHHDKLKDEYCKNNNIKLIRILYWDSDNIEQILKDNNIILNKIEKVS